MNVLNPVSSIMSKDLIVLQQDDAVQKAKDLFEAHNIHHLPVVESKKVVGMVSKSDLLYFLRMYTKGSGDEFIEQTRLRSWKVGEIMSSVDMISLNKDAPIMDALDIFIKNKVHAIVILDNEMFVGIVTPYDILKKTIREGLVSIDYNTVPGKDLTP